MRRSLVVSGTALLLIGRHAECQAAAANPPWPAGRAHHMMFYDDVRQRVIVTGGTAVDRRRNYELLNDLWSFDGTAWTQLTPPGTRLSAARIDMDAHKRILMFGGFTDSAVGDLRVL